MVDTMLHIGQWSCTLLSFTTVEDTDLESENSSFWRLVFDLNNIPYKIKMQHDIMKTIILCFFIARTYCIFGSNVWQMPLHSKHYKICCLNNTIRKMISIVFRHSCFIQEKGPLLSCLNTSHSIGDPTMTYFYIPLICTVIYEQKSKNRPMMVQHRT